jgi:hypothetical protein
MEQEATNKLKKGEAKKDKKSRKKLIISVGAVLILSLGLTLFIVSKNKSANKKSVNIWHQVVAASNKIGDFATSSPSSDTSSKLTESVIGMNSAVDDAKFNASNLSYMFTGSERKQQLEDGLTKIKDYNSKLKSALDVASANSDQLTSEQIEDLKKLSEKLKKELEAIVQNIKFSENLSDNYYMAYEYPQSLSKKLSDAKKAEEEQAASQAQTTKEAEEALSSSKTAVNGFLTAYVRKDFMAMRKSMTTGFQNEFKFSDIEAGWGSSHPKSYRIIDAKKDGSNFLVSVNITYFNSYTDLEGRVSEYESTNSQKYRVSELDSGAYLVDGEVYDR